MDVVLIIISFLLVIGGLLGCVLPVLPGPPLAYMGLLLAHVTDKVEFSVVQLVSWLVLVIVLQGLDYITPMLGSKYTGGSEYGNRGCIAGTILGLFFIPWGIVAGPFIGAVLGEDLQNFYSTINRFFQYGIQQIDVVQFDTSIGEVVTLTQASENIQIKGRGGTNFQPFIDFVSKHPEYDGAIIYTDGYAHPPTIPSTMRTPLCWVLRSEKELKEHEKWMRESGKVCVIENNN